MEDQDKKITPVTWDARPAAAYLGITYGLLLDLARKGLIPHIKFGDRYKFRKAALDNWLDEQERRSVESVVEVDTGAVTVPEDKKPANHEYYGAIRRIKA